MSQIEKIELRAKVRAAFPGADVRVEESESICRRMEEWLENYPGAMIASYMPIEREADIEPLLRRLLERGWRVCLPRTECGEMTFHQVDDLDHLIPGAWQIRLPPKDAPLVTAQQIDIAIVPVEAADLNGYRLGKGGGYFDRYLPGCRCIRCGVAMRYQIVDSIPLDHWDEPLDRLCTPDAMIEFTKA